MSAEPFNVLFLCTGNSARSIMAECYLNHVGSGKFRAYSAGSQPKGAVNPRTIQLLQSLNHDTAQLRSKSWSEFARPGARRSISCSPSATTPRAKPARSGRASR
jgi:protein-tyrosine-phosphatase